MPPPEWDGARTSVVQRLQSITKKHPPGTEVFEVADHAISLAIATNRGDQSPGFLFRNLWRNAQFIVRRRRRLTFDAFDEDSVIDRRIATGELVCASAPESPEDQIVAIDLAERIRGAAAEFDPRGAECFDCLVAGETLAVTARSLSITPSRVKRVRAQIRAVARLFAYRQRAA